MKEEIRIEIRLMLEMIQHTIEQNDRLRRRIEKMLCLLLEYRREMNRRTFDVPQNDEQEQRNDMLLAVLHKTMNRLEEQNDLLYKLGWCTSECRDYVTGSFGADFFSNGQRLRDMRERLWQQSGSLDRRAGEMYEDLQQVFGEVNFEPGHSILRNVKDYALIVQEIGHRSSYLRSCLGELAMQLESERMCYQMAERPMSPPPPTAAPPKTPPPTANPTAPKTAPTKRKGVMDRLRQLFGKQPPEPVPPRVDSVQFSAVAPEKVTLGNYFPINIVMYVDEMRQVVEDIINSRGEKTVESKSGYHDVAHDARIKVVLSSRDVPIEDGVEERSWHGKYLNFEFAVMIPKNYEKTQVFFSAAVYINEIIATKLKLILDCKAPPRQNLTFTREDVVSAFVSYASQDRSRVAAIIQGMEKARPDMNIFFDVECLKSGQRWEDVLKTEIENRDILFLCWSKFAKESKWVDMEWRYALQRKGEDCIEPIPIDPPDVCPPPAELKNKHFNDKMLYVIKASMKE